MRIPRLLLATLLALAAPAFAADAPIEVDARGTLVRLPALEGYLRVSDARPELIGLAQKVAPEGAVVEEMLVHETCMSDAPLVECPIEFDLTSLPLEVTAKDWAAMRLRMLDQLRAGMGKRLASMVEDTSARVDDALGEGVFQVTDARTFTVLAPDDPRAVRFHVNGVATVNVEGEALHQFTLVAQFTVYGQMMIATAVKLYPVGGATPQSVKPQIEAFDRFLAALYALNPP